SSRRRHTRFSRDWSSDVCSSDLGTFLAETIKHIHSKFKGMEGMWQKYVKEDLIPRMNGFELLMASYAMAHLKMDMLLSETGYVRSEERRVGKECRSRWGRGNW